MTHPIQHIGNTILLVMMDVEKGHEAEFDRWYNEEHLPERMEIPGYVSARRFKLEDGEGVLKHLCIWELEDPSPLESEMSGSPRARPSWIREEANNTSRSEPGPVQAGLPVGRGLRGPLRFLPDLWPSGRPKVSRSP